MLICYSHYINYSMNSTIQISKETKSLIGTFGTKEDTYEDIIKRMYGLAVKEQLREFLMSSDNTISLDELIERQESCQAENQFAKLINLQQNAFFWKPRKKFNGADLNVKKALYIAFFYRWLRVCSHTKPTEIATELGVNDSRLTEWKKKAEPKLAKYFPDTLFDSLKGVAPVIFHKKTHKIIKT